MPNYYSFNNSEGGDYLHTWQTQNMKVVKMQVSLPHGTDPGIYS